MIDTHTHAKAGCSVDEARQTLAHCAFDKGLLAAVALDHWGVAGNEDCARLVAAFPDRLIGLVGIHPPDVDRSLRDIEAYAKRGFIGVKLIPTVGYYPDEERFLPIFEELNARKWLVLIHCGWCSKGVKERDLPQSTRFSDPYHIEPLARVFKDIDFLLAHGGGRTFFPRAAELTSYHENIYIDTCPGQGTWVLRHGGEWLDVLCWDRVLFGTDVLIGQPESAALYDEKAYLVKSLVGWSGHKAHMEPVLHDNAARLLRRHGIEVSPAAPMRV